MTVDLLKLLKDKRAQISLSLSLGGRKKSQKYFLEITKL